MRTVLRSGCAALLVLATVVVAPGQAAAQACTWQPAVLALPPGAIDGGIGAGDGDGMFAGWTAGGGGPLEPTAAAIWHGAEVVPIDPAFNMLNTIHGVNSSGTVVGLVLAQDLTTSAVIYRDGTWHRLPKAGRSSSAYDVNSAGDAVGFDRSEDPAAEQLMIWPDRETGAPRALPAPRDLNRADPTPRIDDDGTVVATYSRTMLDQQGFVWTSGASAPTRLTPYRKGDAVMVYDIRNGHIVGESQGDDGLTGVEWNTSGQIVRTFPIRPTAVSSAGLVIGATIADNQPVVWGPDETAEPVLPPEGSSSHWLGGIADDTVGGGASGEGGVVPVRWHRSC